MSFAESRPKVHGRFILLYLTNFVARARAADLIAECRSVADKWIGNEQQFRIVSWINRGICVRSNNVENACYATFTQTLTYFDETRKAEYAGATSVLALLPTIGALLGAPTTEIWRLLTVIPFGGFLAMTLSFGGVILPVRVEDYENDVNGRKATIGRSVTSRANALVGSEDAQDNQDAGAEQVARRVLERIRQKESQRLAKGHFWIGLFAMLVLSFGAQAAMIVVEQGAVVVWWCVSRWWMHFWYFLVTATAFLENYYQVPFSESWKLYVSDVPYDITIRNGDTNSILQKPGESAASAKQVLHQLASVRAGTVTVHGSKQYTKPCNAVLVMISVARHGPDRSNSAMRSLGKTLSIAVFVAGTAIFASAQLLALPVAVFVLTLILGAGVGSRAITDWIVSNVSRTEPLIHVIVNTQQEAQGIIAQILSIDDYEKKMIAAREEAQNVEEAQKTEEEARKIQVELGGHIFIKKCRVGHRSAWHLRALGILAEPFDLRKVDHPDVFANSTPSGLD